MMKKIRKSILLTWIFLIPVSLQPGGYISAAGCGEVRPVSGNAVSSGGAAANPQELDGRLEEAVRASDGRNVDYAAGSVIEFSADTLSRLAGKNVTLAMHTGKGIAFSVSGGEVYRPDSPVRFTLCEESSVPEEVKARIPGTDTVCREFAMEEKDSWLNRVNVHLFLGMESAGRHAVLYYYDEAAGVLRQTASFRITESGNAMFGLTRGDEYLVAVMDGYVVQPGDTFSHIAVKHNVSVAELAAVNPHITDIDRIGVGQPINIP